MKGRKPIPTKVRMLRGNPSKRPLPQNEPTPEPGCPSCPNHLSDEAKREWARISEELLRAGLLTQVDRAALAGYCQSWGLWVEACLALSQSGTVIKTESGFPMQNPYLSVANKALANIGKFLVEFGMSPSSRTRISATTAAPQDKLESFLKPRLAKSG